MVSTVSFAAPPPLFATTLTTLSPRSSDDEKAPFETKARVDRQRHERDKLACARTPPSVAEVAVARKRKRETTENGDDDAATVLLDSDSHDNDDGAREVASDAEDEEDESRRVFTASIVSKSASSSDDDNDDDDGDGDNDDDDAGVFEFSGVERRRAPPDERSSDLFNNRAALASDAS